MYCKHLVTQDRLDNAIGKAVFDRFWVSSPASTKGTDGLGPLYNARSCAECHVRTGRGTITLSSSEDGKPIRLHKSTLVRIGLPDGRMHPIYGTQIQPQAIAGMNGEAKVKITWQKKKYRYPDQTIVPLRKPKITFENWGYGTPETFGYSIRVAPSVRGLNVIDNLPEHSIIKNADPDDKNNDGISGRVAWRYDPVSKQKKKSDVTVGRQTKPPFVDKPSKQPLTTLVYPLVNSQRGTVTVQPNKPTAVQPQMVTALSTKG